jgi:flavin reductase (DIM6/NTAB) family NADH-FMN oxidoreductase RutF
MPVITKEEINGWERFFRANFINSITGFKPVSLIGTINKQGQTNLGIFSSIVHLGSNPALVGYINRPLDAAPHTIANIEATGVYTINHIHTGILEAAHQTSAKYAASVSEFDEVGLTPVFRAGVFAPFVAESKLKYYLELREIIPIKFNRTFMVIGEIMELEIEDGLLLDDGFLQIDKAGSLASNGTDAYYLPTLIDRYAYAKPGLPPRKITN